MKRIAIALTLILAFSASYGQSNKVVSAWNYMKPEYNELDKAKVAIDLAAQHPKTQGQAKTWYYRGLVYHKLYMTKDESFSALDPNPLKEAYLSFVKAKELDVKKRYEDKIIFKIKVAGTEFFNKGSQEYQDKKFIESLESFETVLELGTLPYINQVDTGAFFNAAIAADQAGILDKALAYYQKSIELKYNGSDVYHYVAQIYVAMGDTVNSVQAYMDGIEAYPDNSVFLYIKLMRYYLERQQLDQAAKYIRPAVEKDPENFSLWNVYGSAFEDTDIEESIMGYSRAIEINPEFFDPYYNIGTIYFNQGVELNNEAMSIPLDQTEKYDATVIKRDELFKKALPFYEKAHELDENFKGVLVALKEIYYRFKMTEKLADIKAKLDSQK
ncbi:MAG: tetratricopeptide repeat protein [Bacteroidales bacterium]|nr:tetratricopeptide repeat protein [Bacteroidales bacterium]